MITGPGVLYDVFVYLLYCVEHFGLMVEESLACISPRLLEDLQLSSSAIFLELLSSFRHPSTHFTEDAAH